MKQDEDNEARWPWPGMTSADVTARWGTYDHAQSGFARGCRRVNHPNLDVYDSAPNWFGDHPADAE